MLRDRVRLRDLIQPVAQIWAERILYRMSPNPPLERAADAAAQRKPRWATCYQVK